MSELIDRKELLKCFCITKDGKRIPEVDCDNHEITISIKDIKRIIREQPTVNTRTPMANILESIVTSLESEKTVFLGTRTEQTDTILIDDAINIVKQEINNGLE